MIDLDILRINTKTQPPKMPCHVGKLEICFTICSVHMASNYHSGNTLFSILFLGVTIYLYIYIYIQSYQFIFIS